MASKGFKALVATLQYQMRGLIVAFLVLLAGSSRADDLQTLKAAAVRLLRGSSTSHASLAANRKGEGTESSYGNELTEIFRDFGEDQDQEATSVLTNALEHCPKSVQREQALKAINDAQEMATRFVKDFGGLEGV